MSKTGDCEVGDRWAPYWTPGNVKWSKIQALFSTRHSKDKASGKNWALLKQRNKMSTSEIKEDFLVNLQQEDWGSKSKVALLRKKFGHVPIGLCGGIYLRKKLRMHLGEDSWT